MTSAGILAAIENENREDIPNEGCAAYVDALEDGVEKRRFTCTRSWDHDGYHVAGGNDGPLAVWY